MHIRKSKKGARILGSDIYHKKRKAKKILYIIGGIFVFIVFNLVLYYLTGF